MSWILRLARLLEKAPRLILGFLMLCTLMSVWALTSVLQKPLLSTKISHLADAHSPALRAYQAGLDRYGSYEHLYLSISGKDSTQIQGLRNSLIQEIRDRWSPWIISVQGAKNDAFLQRHALYYLDPKQLSQISQNLKSWRDCKRSANPCPDTAAPRFVLGGTAYPPDVESSLRQILAGKTVPALDYDSSQKLWTAHIQIRPKSPASDLELSNTLWEQAQSLNSILLRNQIRTQWSGSYTLAPQYWHKLQTLGLSALAGMVCLLLLIWILRPRTWNASLLALGGALSASLSGAALSLWVLWGTGLTWDLFFLSAWIIALSLGLGLAFSLALSILDSKAPSPVQRVAEGLHHWTRPLLSGALALGLVWIIAQSAPFAGFKIFGSSLSLFLLATGLWNLLWVSVFCLCFKELPKLHRPVIEIYPNPKARTWAFGTGLLVLLLSSVLLLPKLQLQPEAFSRFQLQKASSPLDSASALGRRDAQTFIALAQDPAEMSQFLQSLEQDPIPGISASLSPASIYPSAADQEERSIWIEDIHRLSQNSAFKKAPASVRAWAGELNRLSKVRPFGLRDIPDWTVELLREKDGSYGSVALLSAAYQAGDFHSVAAIRAHLEKRAPHMLFASPDLVYVELLREMQSAKAWPIWGSAVFLLCLLLLNWHGWRKALQPLLLGALWLWCSAGLWLLLNHTLNTAIWASMWGLGLYALCLMLWSSFPSTSPRNQHES